jgi:hypothetical protein
MTSAAATQKHLNGAVVSAHTANNDSLPDELRRDEE